MKTSQHDLSVRDVANLLGVSAGTVRRYVRTGALTAYKLPFDPQSKASEQRAEWRIPAEEVERVKQQRAATAAYDRQRFMRAIRG